MAEENTIIWAGKSGREYKYWINPLSEIDTFKAEPGNYIFARSSPDGWYAVYVGETEDLSERFDGHHKMPCIERSATHIHAHTSSRDASVRRAEEADIIARWNPSCNG